MTIINSKKPNKRLLLMISGCINAQQKAFEMSH